MAVAQAVMGQGLEGGPVPGEQGLGERVDGVLDGGPVLAGGPARTRSHQDGRGDGGERQTA